MNAVIPLPLAFGFSSLCFAGIVFLTFITGVVRHNHGGVHISDGCLVTFLSLLLAIAGSAVLGVAIFG